MKFLLAILLFSCHNIDQNRETTFHITQTSAYDTDKQTEYKRLKWFGQEAKKWCASHHYNKQILFLADMALPSGRNRFFVFDMTGDSVISSALAAHGCCNQPFLQTARFSNEAGCGCSSFGKYKTGGKYKGKYGTAYKLSGLDSSNSKAFERNIVLHSYYSVPDSETYPNPIVNSYGCLMVSEKFLRVLEAKIDSSPEPILLWVVN